MAEQTQTLSLELTRLQRLTLEMALEEFAQRRPTRMVAHKADEILSMLNPYHRKISRLPKRRGS